MGLEVGDQRSPSQWWLLCVCVVLCVCRCGKVRQSLSAKRVDSVCPLHAIHWRDWVTGTASGHIRNLSPAAGGICGVHINKHAQTYIWTNFSCIYAYIYSSWAGWRWINGTQYWPLLLLSQRGWYCLCSWMLYGCSVLAAWPAVYICVYIAYKVSCLLLIHTQPCCWRDQLFNQTKRK